MVVVAVQADDEVVGSMGPPGLMDKELAVVEGAGVEVVIMRPPGLMERLVWVVVLWW
jgi:hypothetical protein